MIEEVRRLLPKCTVAERAQILAELRQEEARHPFEVRLNTTTNVILEALHRASDLTIRGIRGIIGEACFVTNVIPTLRNWESLEVIGDLPHDACLRDQTSEIRIQVKMQRKAKQVPLIRDGQAVVEVQRTRGGTRDGEETRPYKFGEFDMLAVCMEPSTGDWNRFYFIPQRWLIPRQGKAALIEIMQPVSLDSDSVWTSDFDEAVRRLRADLPRPAEAHVGFRRPEPKKKARGKQRRRRK